MTTDNRARIKMQCFFLGGFGGWGGEGGFSTLGVSVGGVSGGAARCVGTHGKEMIGNDQIWFTAAGVVVSPRWAAAAAGG